MRLLSFTASIVVILGLISAAAQADFDQNHGDLTKALAKTVVYTPDGGSEVNYKALQNHPADLILYLKLLGRVPEKTYKTWTTAQQEAFLINAFNAFALQLVKDNYPVESIQKIKFGGGFWKMKFFRIFWKEYNLEGLRDKILHDFPDPRIMFALNTASVGSPRLRNEAYTADKLDAQLDDQVKTFLHFPAANQIDTEKKVAKLSPVFKDLTDEFTKSGTTVAKFIAPFVTDDVKVRADLEGGNYTVEYLDPDWKLNKLSK